MELVKDGGPDRLACWLDNMSDTLLAPSLPLKSLEQMVRYSERVLHAGRSLKTFMRADSGTHWWYQKMLEVQGTTEAESFIQEIFGKHRHLISKPKNAILRETGLRMQSTDSGRTFAASIGSRVGILPELWADLVGPLGEQVRRGSPESGTLA